MVRFGFDKVITQGVIIIVPISSYLLDIHTVLTKPLHDTEYFKMFFLDFGALCWKNSLEFSADSLQKKMINKKILFTDEEVA